MITVGVIRNGSTYLAHHLRKNDYWQEGEKEVQGEWIGQGAQRLGLEGVVADKSFDALRRNRHPVTGKRLTARENKARMALFDIQLSAPKDVSVLAMVGGDERVRAAFLDAAKTIVTEMERYAAVRERRGEARNAAHGKTGRVHVVCFIPESMQPISQLAIERLPQKRRRAHHLRVLQCHPSRLLRVPSGVREHDVHMQLRIEIAAGIVQKQRADEIAREPERFGVEHLRERFSKRAHQVRELAEEFAQRKGRKPTKREVEVLVRQSRADKLTEVTTPEVRARQRAQLKVDEATALDDLVRRATVDGPRAKQSQGLAHAITEAALRHVFERRSVAREGEVLGAALELHPQFRDWRSLQRALENHPDVIRQHGELTLQSIRREEAATVRRVQDGRNTRFRLGEVAELPSTLTRGQKAAARALLANRDFVSVLVGDAGTGKTTVLTAIEAAHRAAGGQRFLVLAPTTRAREALVSAGFEGADTVQRFLVSDTLQAQAARRVVLVDEAGLLSTGQLDALTRLATDMRARLLLVGDTKQHYSVQRGDALRQIVEDSHTPVVRLSEVLRQRDDEDRKFSRLMASGEVLRAFLQAERRGLIEDAKDDETLFTHAADHYASNLAQGIDTLVVIPFWDEIERFNRHARAALRRTRVLGETEIMREAVKPLSWTEEEKAHWNRYQVGDRLLFLRDTRFFKRGAAAEVIEVLPDGLRVCGPDKRSATITRKQRGTFEVGRMERLPVAAGDRLLIRGRDDSQDFTNGDIKTVEQVDPAANDIVFTDGQRLPPTFQAWTYGHALTAYRAQGSTAEESMLVLGEVAERALSPRQFYVGNTRFRGKHRIYVSHRDAILQRLTAPDPGRELATEFLARHRMTRAEQLALGPLLAALRARHRWLAALPPLRTPPSAPGVRLRSTFAPTPRPLRSPLSRGRGRQGETEFDATAHAARVSTYAIQSSTFSPGTRMNSRVLSVTNVAPSASACPASSTS